MTDYAHHFARHSSTKTKKERKYNPEIGNPTPYKLSSFAIYKHHKLLYKKKNIYHLSSLKFPPFFGFRFLLHFKKNKKNSKKKKKNWRKKKIAGNSEIKHSFFSRLENLKGVELKIRLRQMWEELMWNLSNANTLFFKNWSVFTTDIVKKKTFF